MMSIDARPAAAQTAAQATTLSSAERRFLHVGTARPFVGADNQRHRQNGAHPDSRRVLPLGAGAGPRRALIVRHDDAAREAACDRESHIGRLARGLDEAGPRGWVVVSMKQDWRRAFSEPAAKQ